MSTLNRRTVMNNGRYRFLRTLASIGGKRSLRPEERKELNDYIARVREAGNNKVSETMTSDSPVKDRKFVKVIGFPVDGEDQINSESMWVILIDGDKNNGTGILDNSPVFCKAAEYGDLIKFEGGTEDTHPRYIKTISKAMKI